MNEKPFTVEQLERINAAILKHREVGSSKMQELIISELTAPELKPEVGQVLYWPEDNDNYVGFDESDGPILISGCARPLNQTEVGPDWVPKAEFVKLLNFAILVNVNKWHGSPHPDGIIHWLHSKSNKVLASLPEEYRGK